MLPCSFRAPLATNSSRCWDWGGGGGGLTCRRALPDGVKPGGSTERDDCVCRRPDSLGPPPQPVVGHDDAFPHGPLQPAIEGQQQGPQQRQRLAQQLFPLRSLPCNTIEYGRSLESILRWASPIKSNVEFAMALRSLPCKGAAFNTWIRKISRINTAVSKLN